jgi:signal transduction histidine kinase
MCVPDAGRVEMRVEASLEEPSEADVRKTAALDPGETDEEPAKIAMSDRATVMERGLSSPWLLLAIGWASVTAWHLLLAATCCPRWPDATLGAVLLRHSIWGLVALPALGLLAVRFPVRLWHVPGYFALGLILSTLCAGVSWYLQPSMRWGTIGDALLWEGARLWDFGVFAVVAHLAAYNRRDEASRRRETVARRQIAQARLQALEMQLRPHFLFNALHSVAALLGSNPDAAGRMLQRIEDFLRVSLEGSGAPTVALHEELRFLRHYLGIQSVRFQDRLSVEFHVDPESLGAQVPHLLLQPVVENAVRHGIAPRASGGRIFIRAARKDDRLELAVEDDGVGCPASLEAPRFGLGLSNTQARLRLLYGRDHRFDVRGGGGGFAVIVNIPFQRAA